MVVVIVIVIVKVMVIVIGRVIGIVIVMAILDSGGLRVWGSLNPRGIAHRLLGVCGSQC